MDWTPVVTALASALGLALAGLLAWVLRKYVWPWLRATGLDKAATVAVNAAEAVLGRYTGAQKWDYALELLARMGIDTNNGIVVAALKAAWEALNLTQIIAGVKDADEAADVVVQPVVEGEQSEPRAEDIAKQYRKPEACGSQSETQAEPEDEQVDEPPIAAGDAEHF